MLILGAGFHALAEVRRDAPVRAPLVLGLPGQKQRADGTWDNWYRTYLADVGRYLSPEPLLQSPVYVRRMAQSGVQVPTYAYAANNPLRYVDPDGRELTDLPFVMGIMMKNYLQ
ncbi:MAG: RHS repeat-associated core domain-containing protein, partial [Phycisphaerales bacterium]